MTARRSRVSSEPSTSKSPSTAQSGDPERDHSESVGATEAGVELPFEEGLAQLEGLVGQLEGGELQLEGALGAFEEGVRLSRQLDHQLNEAEQRVEVLLREGGRWVTEPLDADGKIERPNGEES